MAITDELRGFVKDGLQRGTPRPVLGDVLRQAGWQPAQADAALAAFADVDFAIPVPKPTPQLSARDAFLYLVLFTTLYIAAVQFGGLVFQLIHQAFPDPATPAWQRQPAYIGGQIRWAVSSLIVSLPVFLFISVQVNRNCAGTRPSASPVCDAG
jgi:hypothetical protein